MGVSIAACLLGSAVPHQLQVACRIWPYCTAALLLKGPLLLHSPPLRLSTVSLHALQWQEDAHDSSWLDRAWNWLLSPATLTLIAAPVAGLHFAYNVRPCGWQAVATMPAFFGACVPWPPCAAPCAGAGSRLPSCSLCGTPWAALVAGAVPSRGALGLSSRGCSLCGWPALLPSGLRFQPVHVHPVVRMHRPGSLAGGLWPAAGGAGPAAVGPVGAHHRHSGLGPAHGGGRPSSCSVGAGEMLGGIALEPLRLVGACLSRGMRRAAATMWQLLSPCQCVSPLLPPAAQARRFGSAFWPFDLVHAVLCRLARALESAGWQQPEAAGAERAVPEPAPALWPTGSSWLQRLRHVYMLQPELFKCPHAGLTLRPWRLLPAAWRAVSDTARGGRGACAQVWRELLPPCCCACCPPSGQPP